MDDKKVLKTDNEVIHMVVSHHEIGNSSTIKEIMRTNQDGIIVSFLNGTSYLYKEVPQETFENMIKSESAGKFLNANIKGKFEFVKLVTDKEG